MWRLMTSSGVSIQQRRILYNRNRRTSIAVAAVSRASCDCYRSWQPRQKITKHCDLDWWRVDPLRDLGLPSAGRKAERGECD
jgi:hypothetical protein